MFQLDSIRRYIVTREHIESANQKRHRHITHKAYNCEIKVCMGCTVFWQCKIYHWDNSVRLFILVCDL